MNAIYTDRRRFLQATALGGLSIAAPGSLTLAVAQTASTLKIGALLPLTGGGAVYGPSMQKAMQIAVDEVNAAGGAGGRKIELLTEDDQTQPEAGVLAAKKLIDVNGVQAVVGTWSSGVTLAVMPLTLKADIIQMNGSGAPEISTLDDKDLVWRLHPTNDAFGSAFAQVCLARGFNSAGLMAFNNAFGLALTDGFKKAWEKHGKKVSERVVYEGKRPSYRSEVQQILSSKPDVVVMGSYLPDTTIILKEAFQAGATTKWIMPSWSGNDQLVQALGKEATEGVLVMDTAADEKSGSYGEFVKRFGGDKAPNFFALLSYDMIITIALAAEAAGATATSAQINAKIREIANPPGDTVHSFAAGKASIAKKTKVNYDGISGPLDFDARGDVSGNFNISVIKDGKVVREGIVRP